MKSICTKRILIDKPTLNTPIALVDPFIMVFFNFCKALRLLTIINCTYYAKCIAFVCKNNVNDFADLLDVDYGIVFLAGLIGYKGKFYRKNSRRL